MRLPQPL